MSRFLSKLDKLSYIDGINWRVESDVVYQSDSLGKTITVKAGTLTDFASIPRALWNIYPPARFAGPATVHDELYTKQTCTRLEADRVFLEALKVDGVPYMRRYAFYWALRAAGWKAWNDHRKENAKRSQEKIAA